MEDWELVDAEDIDPLTRFDSDWTEVTLSSVCSLDDLDAKHNSFSYSEIARARPVFQKTNRGNHQLCVKKRKSSVLKAQHARKLSKLAEDENASFIQKQMPKRFLKRQKRKQGKR